MKMTMVPEIIDMDMPVEGVFHNLVIAQIKKDYAGQGQKVMNAMWGAGQMMFNKILVVADEGVKIQDYEALAKYAFKNINPATDIYFTQGPMDVLDHSCSKLDFIANKGLLGTINYYYSDKLPLNDANTENAAAYHLVNGQLGFEKWVENKWRLKFVAGAENLLDQNYSLGPDINAFGGRYYNAAQGRSYYVSLAIQLKMQNRKM
jgi:hypothetical protein